MANTKHLLISIILISLISSGYGQVINLNDNVPQNQYSELVNRINQHSAVKNLAKHYSSISITIDNVSVILEFENETLKSINDNPNFEKSDLNIKISKSDTLYLIENYQTMTYFQRFWYLFKICESPRDALTLSGIAMGLRGEA